MCAILPHELFAALFNDYGPFWEKVMLGKKTCSEMSDFWARAKTHACIQDCPADSPDRVVPLAVIGDEVPVVGRSNRCGVQTGLARVLVQHVGDPPQHEGRSSEDLHSL